MINLGNSSIKGIRLGNQRVSEMYLGETPITFTNGYEVGDYYPGAGGYVYWLDGLGGGQVALYQNVISGSTTGSLQWSSVVQSVAGTLSDVAAGQANTAIMLSSISQQPYRVVGALVDLNSGSVVQNAGFTDWYIPSIDALGYVYDNLASQNIAGPWTNYPGSSGGSGKARMYWSSTQVSTSNAWAYQMQDGPATNHGPSFTQEKDSQLMFRPVRTFTSGSI
jgi:hypothetical protein